MITSGSTLLTYNWRLIFFLKKSLLTAFLFSSFPSSSIYPFVLLILFLLSLIRFLASSTHFSFKENTFTPEAALSPIIIIHFLFDHNHRQSSPHHRNPSRTVAVTIIIKRTKNIRNNHHQRHDFTGKHDCPVLPGSVHFLVSHD